MQSYRDNDYAIKFLRGLNEKYSAMRSQIMLSKPLLDINIVFSMLIQQERQLNSELQEPRIVVNVAESRGRGRGSRGQSSTAGGRSGNGKGRGTKVCTYCDKTSHTIDVCYQKHEYPPDYFKKNEGKMINNYVQEDEEFEDDDGALSLMLVTRIMQVAFSLSLLNKGVLS